MQDSSTNGPSALGWAGSAFGWSRAQSSALIATSIVAILAKICGVVLAPGARGVAGAATVDLVDTATGAFAYTLTALLIALVCGASFELARARNIHFLARGGVVAMSGLIVALASPAVVERLTTLPSLALAFVTGIVSLAAGVVVIRSPRSRALGAIVSLLSLAGLFRVVAWETAAMAFDHMNKTTLDVARGFATAAVSLHAIAVLLGAAWIGTRSKWRARILANVAIIAAFAITWFAARGSDEPGAAESILHTSLASAMGLPSPFLLGSVAAFLVPASIFLGIAALLQPRQPPALVGALVLALLSHGAYDVPLQALLITAAAQWAMLSMQDLRTDPRLDPRLDLLRKRA